MKIVNCPICSSELVETEHNNNIFNKKNYYCSNCHSYHITSSLDLSDYYSKQYHDNFSFVKSKKYYKLFCNFQIPRAYSRYIFFRKHTQKKVFDNYLEIGGGSGHNFLVFDLFNRLKSYVIVEPNLKFNINKPNLRYFNNLFENIEDSSLGKVDVVMLFHVLEHIYDVNSFLERIRKLGCKYLYFEVPNIENKKVLEESLLNHPHYHHYSIKSLKYLFKSMNITDYKLFGINPITYHPYKKVPFLKRIIYKGLRANEIIDEKGLYIRGLIKF